MKKRWVSNMLTLAQLGIAVINSGCFETARVLDGPHPASQKSDTIAIRVQHCYLSPQGHLTVLALGGVAPHLEGFMPTVAEANVPHDPVWFDVDYVTLAKTTPYGVLEGGLTNIAALPMTTLQLGSPDMVALARDGYVEISFKEVDQPPHDQENKTGQPNVWIWSSTQESKQFPERLGVRPVFYVTDGSPEERMPFSINHQYIDNPHDWTVVLWPVTVPLACIYDVVTFPILIFLPKAPLPFPNRLLKKAAFGDARADAAAFGLGQCGFSLPMMV